MCGRLRAGRALVLLAQKQGATPLKRGLRLLYSADGMGQRRTEGVDECRAGGPYRRQDGEP